MSQTVATELAHLLTQEQTLVDQLNLTLKEEFEALAKHDIKSIESSASVKSKLLKAFSKQVQSRLRSLSTQKLEASETGMNALLQSLDLDVKPAIELQWQTLKKDFKSLLLQNETNGTVIQHSQVRTRSLLNILHGNKNQPNLYNESGSAQTPANSHILGEA
jgi:flagellar biosynthesis/type III secretory pathway chaperone